MVEFHKPGPDRIKKKAAAAPRDPFIDALIELLDVQVTLSIAYLEALQHFNVHRKKGKNPSLPPDFPF